MKLRLCLALLCLSACQQPRTAGPPPVCIASYRIDHTDVLPDDSAIMFFMTDRSVYRNRLRASCPGLHADTRGFTYEPSDPGSDEICSDLVTIRTNTSHFTCLLGAFEKVSGPPPR